MITRICKGCGKEFTTEKNAQKYCSEECQKKQRKKTKQLKKRCSWCGRSFVTTENRKYCSDDCERRASGKGKRKIPVAMSLSEAARISRESGMSYGKYFEKYGYEKVD